jgi:hypothetical protein
VKTNYCQPSVLHQAIGRRSLYIVSDRRQGKFWAISPFTDVAIFRRDRACSSIRAPHAVHTHDEESRRVKRSSRPSKKRSPPIAHISASRQSMTDDHGVVPCWGQHTQCSVCNGNIEKGNTRFKGKLRNDGYFLIRNQRNKRVLQLRLGSFLHVFSH